MGNTICQTRKVLRHLKEKARDAAAGAAAPLPTRALAALLPPRAPPPLPTSLSSSAISTPQRAPSLLSRLFFSFAGLVRRAQPRAFNTLPLPINKRGLLENNRGTSLQHPAPQRNCARDPAAIPRPERGRSSLHQPRVAAVLKKPGAPLLAVPPNLRGAGTLRRRGSQGWVRRFAFVF